MLGPRAAGVPLPPPGLSPSLSLSSSARSASALLARSRRGNHRGGQRATVPPAASAGSSAPASLAHRPRMVASLSATEPMQWRRFRCRWAPVE
jgi:hypothetical protein